jgi:type I restriction enzyme M protein
MVNNFKEKANFIWQVADDILRGTFKAHEYGDVILPFVVLRRLDQVLESHKDEVIKQYENFKSTLDEERLIPVLNQAAGGLNFYNHSFYDLRRLTQDPNNIELNFNNYLNGYSKNVREIIENFQLGSIISKLAKNDLLYRLVDMFAGVDLSPNNVTNHEMGYIFEELLRRFSEMSNETAGEHYTPREVIRLMVSLLLAEHKDGLQGKGIIRSVYDPACGTGGMLITAKDYMQNEINPDLEVVMYGQELNEQTYAIAKSDVLIMGENAENIRLGNSFTQDKFKGQKFSFMLSNPPFGVSWKKEQNFIKNEEKDPHGRFHAGTPRVSDGSLLFLQHMISKMEAGGSRIAIIFNGSPLFVGDAGSGESDIRKWIIENDWLEAIVAMPTEMFYNTGIATYIWIVTNRKLEGRRGKVQLINTVDYAAPMQKSLGNKRQYFTDDHISQITEIYKDFSESKVSKIFDNEEFGFTKIKIERPEYNAKGEITRDKSGNPKPDSNLRDYEKIPLMKDIEEYFQSEVLPYVSDAWMDRDWDRVGYEINFTKYFFEFTQLRPLNEIKADILTLERETDGLLGEIIER